MRAGLRAIRQVGFSLLEVLITLVVLGAGLISLAKFQGTVLQDNGLAKERSVAAQLAEQRIEQFRSFRVLNAAVGAIAYEDISAGAAAPITVANVAYTGSWTVNDFCFPIARNSAAVAVPPPPGVNCRRPLPDFKNVTVKFEWTDQDGALQKVSLATSIAAVDPAYSGRVIQINAKRPAAGNELPFP